MLRQDVSVTLPWMGAGTEYLLRAVTALPDDALSEPSRLPDWTRAHVVAHVARNAEALGRLATWARTGIETPMYAGPEQRAADIARSARGSVETLRAELVGTAADLDATLAALDDQSWQAVVLNAQGLRIRAVELPWMRVREVFLHAVDLDAGVEVTDLPPDVVDSLLDDVTGTLSAKQECPPVVLVSTDPDRDRSWALGPGDGLDHDAVRVSGAEADLLGWLTGRSDTDRLDASAPIPVLPRWI